MTKFVLTFIASSLITFAQDIYSVIPLRVSSDRFSFLPFKIYNPLNLKYKVSPEASFFVTPSKFLIPELNSFGSYLNFGLPFKINSSLLIESINAKKFSYYSLKYSIQMDLFDKFNFATSLGGDLFSISRLGKKFSTNSDFFLEYQPYEKLIVSFAYKIPFSSDFQLHKTAVFGIQYAFWEMMTVGYSTHIYLGLLTSQNFYFTFSPVEKIALDIDIRTIPQTITLSFGYNFSDFNLSLFLQYNNKLIISQTICLTIYL